MDFHGTEKKDSCLQNDKASSPPLSARLREISNNLKLFCSATPLRVKLSEEVDKQQNNKTMAFTDSSIEPRTPTAETCTRFNQKEVEIAKYCSPWEKFSQRSSGMKVVFKPFCLFKFYVYSLYHILLIFLPCLLL